MIQTSSLCPTQKSVPKHIDDAVSTHSGDKTISTTRDMTKTNHPLTLEYDNTNPPYTRRYVLQKIQQHFTP